MIQLTRSGLTGAANLGELARQFQEAHVFRLPRLLHADLIDKVLSRLDRCLWTTCKDGSIASEALPDGLGPVNILNFAANTAEFLGLMRSITECQEIKFFSGRVYKMMPIAEHFDSWHSDIGKTHNDRLVGMSINLGPNPYEGGVFRLRDEASGETLCELPNTGQGDAIVFRISPELKHMITPLVGTEPKTAFAGWFRSGDTDFYSMLRKDAAVARSTDEPVVIS